MTILLFYQWKTKYELPNQLEYQLKISIVITSH